MPKASMSFNSIDFSSNNAIIIDSSLSRKIDLSVLYVLFLFVLTFQIQEVFEWISTYRVRELLYGYLYIRVIFFYRLKIPYALLLVIGYLVYSFLTMMHTVIAHDMNLAVLSFLRFVNVALLAPLAAIIIANKKQFSCFLYLWVFIFILSFITAIYQLLGGDMSWLFGDYVAIRGGLVRAKTLLGEPNIGAMASTFVLAYAIYGTKNNMSKAMLIIFSSIFIIISLSKAAIAGLLVLACLILVYNNKTFDVFRARNPLKIMQMLIIVTCIIIVLFVVLPELAIIVDRYFDVAISAFTGTGETRDTASGVWEDFTNRAYINPQRYIENAFLRSTIPLVHFFIGSSFGAAGSVATGLSIEGAVGPHNSYLEIFLVGGLLMLLLFLSLIRTVYRRLALIRKQDSGLGFLLIWFIMFVIFMISYPIIYEPFLGALFWMLVGIACNSKLYREISRAGQENCNFS